MRWGGYHLPSFLPSFQLEGFRLICTVAGTGTVPCCAVKDSSVLWRGPVLSPVTSWKEEDEEEEEEEWSREEVQCGEIIRHKNGE